MPLYRITDQKFVQLKRRPIQKEKDLQRLIEPNLLELLDVHFLETEYSTTSGGRIDTLGVDRNGAPVIIEYKRNQNDNVINQALSYRKWLTAQKPEFFEMLVRKRLPEEIATGIQLDWKRPRIICIAETFNRFDVDTADLLLSVFRVELMTYRIYENDIFHLEPLQIVNERQTDAAGTPIKAPDQEAGAAEYSVELHRSRGSAEIKALFDDLRARVLALGPQVVERAVQAYISYRAAKNFAEVHIQKSAIRIHLRGIYDDPTGRAMARKVPDTHKWTLDWHVTFSDPMDLDYVMSLVEQSYNDVA
jgi:predicted transport protein